MSNQMQLFWAEMQLKRISKLVDPLEKMNALIDLEIFRSILEKRTKETRLQQRRKTSL